MEKVKIFEYYAFGFNYQILLSINSNDTNESLYLHLEGYIAFIDKLNLSVTKSALEQKAIYKDVEKYKKLAKKNATKNLKLTPSEIKTLIEKLNSIENVLDAELATKLGYILDEKRISNEILTGNISKLFNASYFNLLPSVAQHDFTESGLCLAFDRYTAVAFHVLRGTEDVLKYYYSMVLAKVPKDSDTWGTYEKALVDGISNSVIIPVPPEQLMINLTSLRRFYRNKTQHPQLVFTTDEAQDLLFLCIKTVNELISDLKKRGLI